jgi:hypothetical protein
MSGYRQETIGREKVAMDAKFSNPSFSRTIAAEEWEIKL